MSYFNLTLGFKQKSFTLFACGVLQTPTDNLKSKVFLKTVLVDESKLGLKGIIKQAFLVLTLCEAKGWSSWCCPAGMKHCK